MKKVLLFLLLGFITKTNYAQIDSSKLSSGGMIQYSRSGLLRVEKFTINGKKETYREINTRLMNAQVSAEEFKQYVKYRNLTSYVATIALASLLASKIDEGNTYKNTSSNVLLGLGAGFIIPEAIFAGKRNKHFKRSIELYNQQFQ